MNSKFIRYFFILVLYNAIIAGIAKGTQWIGVYYGFNYASWSIIDWWVYIGLFCLIAGFFLYLTPYYEQVLCALLERIITKVKMAKSNNVKELEAHLERLRKDD